MRTARWLGLSPEERCKASTQGHHKVVVTPGDRIMAQETASGYNVSVIEHRQWQASRKAYPINALKYYLLGDSVQWPATPQIFDLGTSHHQCQ